MKKYLTFWLIFFALFLLFVFPTTNYFSTGIPEHLQRATIVSQFWLISNIVSGILIYAIAPFQFSAYIRRKYFAEHRTIGLVYILLSIYCILTLYISIIPNSLCKSCQIFQYLITTLWLIFIVAAYISIIKKRIILHKQLMISSFIGAAYFVVVRVIDRTAMKFFKYISQNESQAFLISDIAAWFVPLAGIWIYWIMLAKKLYKRII